MNYDDAYELIKSKYPGSIQITDDLRITDWQACKHIYHGIGVGVNPEDYSITQKELMKISGPGGLIAYVQKGGKLPTIEHIRAYQNAIKTFCEDQNLSVRNNQSTFRGESSITFFNKTTQQVGIFNRETKIFITAYKIAERSVNNYLETGNIGESKVNSKNGNNQLHLSDWGYCWPSNCEVRKLLMIILW
jgi:hypothetical protein